MPYRLGKRHNGTSGALHTIEICFLEDREFLGGLPSLLIIHILTMIVCVFVIIVNTFIIWALWSRRRIQSSRSTWLVLSLSVSGLLGSTCYVATLSGGFLQTNEDLQDYGESFCLFRLLSGVFVWILMTTTQGAIAFDRYVLIVHGMRYSDLMTKRRTWAIIGFIWLLSFAGTLSIAMAYMRLRTRRLRCNNGDLVQAWEMWTIKEGTFLLSLIIVSVAHLRLRSVAKQSEALHEKTRGAIGEQATSKRPFVVFKSTRVVVGVIACYVLTFIPCQILLVLELLNEKSAGYTFVQFVLAYPVHSLTYAFNPIMYTWWSVRLREDLQTSWKKVLRCIRNLLCLETNDQKKRLAASPQNSFSSSSKNAESSRVVVFDTS